MPASARMVPSTYGPFLAAVATSAAALIGLLFVAVSNRDETIFGPRAIPGGEALAITAFTGLVNSFVVSLLALIPGTNIGWAAAIMALISLYSLARLSQRLRVYKNPVFQLITVIAYGAQLVYGVILLANPHRSGDVENVAFILFATLVVALGRAWSLLRGKHLPAGGAVADAANMPPHPQQPTPPQQPTQPQHPPGAPR